MTDTTTEAPERIYLEPGEPENWDPHFGRAWCEDDVWEREADDSGVAYVRADLVTGQLEALRESADLIDRLRGWVEDPSAAAQEEDAIYNPAVFGENPARRALDRLDADDPYGGEERCPDIHCDKGQGHDGFCSHEEEPQ